MPDFKFVTGESYTRCSICDSDCIFTITIVSRTPKTAMVKDSFGRVSRYKIHDCGDYEYIKAGNYSMAGGWSAKDVVATEAPMTPEEMGESFTKCELRTIFGAFADALYGVQASDLPPNCVPFRKMA